QGSLDRHAVAAGAQHDVAQYETAGERAVDAADFDVARQPREGERDGSASAALAVHERCGERDEQYRDARHDVDRYHEQTQRLHEPLTRALRPRLAGFGVLLDVLDDHARDVLAGRLLDTLEPRGRVHLDDDGAVIGPQDV